MRRRAGSLGKAERVGRTDGHGRGADGIVTDGDVADALRRRRPDDMTIDACKSLESSS